MGHSIDAEDNQFAVIRDDGASSSSGRGGGRSSRNSDNDEVSWFNEDPSESACLRISANDDDADGNHFDVGETYDISWDGGTIEDAVVVRSDGLGEDAGVVVFEGIDESGDSVTIVWTPDFDLDSWYDSATSQGYKTGCYNTDQDASMDYSVMCFGGDVPVMTPNGARAASKLGVGERVQTLDNGFARIAWIGCTTVAGFGAAAAVEFAPHAIGNATRMVLSQQHRVLVRSEQGALLFGSHETLLPAKAFVGLAGVRLRPVAKQQYVHILTENHEVIFAAGAPCETLFLGDMVAKLDGKQHENRDFFPNFHAGSVMHAGPARPMLTVREAQMVLGNGHRISAPERALTFA